MKIVIMTIQMERASQIDQQEAESEVLDGAKLLRVLRGD